MRDPFLCSSMNTQVNKHALQTSVDSAAQEEGTAARGSTCVCPGPQSPTLRQHPVTRTEGGRGIMESISASVFNRGLVTPAPVPPLRGGGALRPKCRELNWEKQTLK